MTTVQMRSYAAQLLDAGDAPLALAVTESLLLRDADDLTALLIRAQAALAMGENETAWQAGAAAYRAATEDDIRFFAARLTALAHANVAADTRAQIWLRRARQYAPSPDIAAQVAEDYRFLRIRNPLSLRGSFGISPSSNINNGSSSDTTFIFVGLGGGDAVLNNEARALSGIGLSAGLDVEFRISESRNAVTFAQAGISGVTYALSQDSRDGLREDRRDENARRLEACAAQTQNTLDRGRALIQDGTVDIQTGQAATPVDTALIAQGEAKIAQGNALVAAGENPPPCVQDTTPLKTGADFSYATLSFGLSHRRILSEGARPTTFALRYSQSWYGGDRYSDSTTLSAAQDWALGDTSLISATAFAEHRSYAQTDVPRALRYGLAGALQMQQPSGSRLTLRARAERTESDLASIAHRMAMVGVSYDLAGPVAGMALGLSADLARDYDYPFQTVYLASRADTELALRVDARLDNFEYFGFRPVVSLQARRVWSNIDRFDQDDLSLSFDLRSAF